MTWNKSKPHFRAEKAFGNFLAIINQDYLGMIWENPSTSYLDPPLGIQGADELIEFANWILEQARLFKEGPNEPDQ